MFALLTNVASANIPDMHMFDHQKKICKANRDSRQVWTRDRQLPVTPAPNQTTIRVESRNRGPLARPMVHFTDV
jgi:hypothetical protein